MGEVKVIKTATEGVTKAAIKERTSEAVEVTGKTVKEIARENKV